MSCRKRDYKRAPYSVQNLVTKRKKQFFENKLKQCIDKPKDLWKANKSLGLPNKSRGCIVGALAENQIVKHDTKSILCQFSFKPGRKFIEIAIYRAT